MERKIDYGVLISALLLICIGVMMVYSASGVFAKEKFGDTYYYLKKEILFCILSLIALFVCIRVDYHRYQKWMLALLGVSIFLCILVAIPGIGKVAGGARRWLSLGGFTFQPSEFVKLSFVIFLAYALAKKREKMEDFKTGLLPSVLVCTFLMGLILVQKDLGTTFVLWSVMMLMLYVGGAKFSYLATGVLVAALSLVVLIKAYPYRMQRITTFLDPWAHMSDSGFQVIQSYLGFNQGGVWGAGLGRGVQKMFFLPAAHTDFIFSVLGEELGLFGVLFIIILFIIMVVRSIKISLQAPDLFGCYLALGLISIIGVQALINFGVVMGLLPTKGLPLPFISHGGSSLIVMSAFIGIILNISSQSQKNSEMI